MPSRTPEELGRLVGRRIRELRHDRGWQQVDLEAHLEGAATRSSISYLESGQTFPSRNTLNALALAFGLPEAALLLDPNELRERVALAVLDCPDEVLPALAKLVDVG